MIWPIEYSEKHFKDLHNKDPQQILYKLQLIWSFHHKQPLRALTLLPSPILFPLNCQHLWPYKGYNSFQIHLANHIFFHKINHISGKSINTAFLWLSLISFCLAFDTDGKLFFGTVEVKVFLRCRGIFLKKCWAAHYKD